MRQTYTRADDERDLQYLTHFRNGLSPYAIARLYAVPTQRVSIRVANIIRADTEHDPEAKAYWRTT